MYTRQRSRALDTVSAFFRLTKFSAFPAVVLSLAALQAAASLNWFQKVDSPGWLAFGIVLAVFIVTWLAVFQLAYKLSFKVSALEDGYLAVKEFQQQKNHNVRFYPRGIETPEQMEWVES